MVSKCANCGKSFFHQYAEWGYEYDGQICCSYKCMREMRAKELTEDGQMRGRRMTQQDIEQLYGLFDGGKTVKEVMQLTGLAHTTVDRYRREWKHFFQKMSTKAPDLSTEAPEMSTNQVYEKAIQDNRICEDPAQAYEKASQVVENVRATAERTTIDAGQLINTLCDIVALIKQIFEKSCH